MVTLEVNNSGEVGRPGVQPANMILLWGLQGFGRLLRARKRKGDDRRGGSERTREVPGT